MTPYDSLYIVVVSSGRIWNVLQFVHIKGRMKVVFFTILTFTEYHIFYFIIVLLNKQHWFIRTFR